MRSIATARALVEAARERDARALAEPEAARMLEALGIATPRTVLVDGAMAARVADFAALGPRVVVKAVAPGLLHKTEVGGVAVVANDTDRVAHAIDAMASRLVGTTVAGYSVSEYVEHEPGLGGELLVGLRWTDDFGPVAAVGAGGVHAELLATSFAEACATAFVTGDMTDAEISRALRASAAVRLLVEPQRGAAPRLDLGTLVATIRRMLAAGALMPDLVRDVEVNPFVVSDGALVAVDALVTLAPLEDERAGEARMAAVSRPTRKIHNLLQPRSVAVVGVSEKRNPGHIIVDNVLRAGFDRDRLFVVKPGGGTIEGCRCVPSVSDLPERVDLLVVAVDAARATEVLAETIEARAAESVILIPGGLDEKKGGEAAAAAMRAALARSRETDWGGPVVNGGNCLGVTSAPGRIDTMFIPKEKLPVPATPVMPVAFLSQSGAFAIAKMSKLDGLHPKYAITVGNQTDLTIGDYLTELADDDVRVFAVYVEGFRPLDGARFVAAAREITRSGRTVVLYRAGRTAAGARASSSHTASIAGDYAVTRALARSAGVVVAESLNDFDDLVSTFALLDGTRLNGARVTAVSNAGFECVALADAAAGVALAPVEGATAARLRAVFEGARIDTLVDAHNPLDLTPMTDDQGFEDAVRALLEDPAVDAGVVACVPLTAALETLPGPDGRFGEGSIVTRLVRLRAEIDKPWVAVVDSGRLYDAMARALEAGGVPTFRSADRAMRLLGTYVRHRLTAEL